MKCSQRATVTIVTVLALVLFASTSRGSITGIVSSDVEGFFGSQSDAFQQSEGPLSPPWPANGPSPYPLTGAPNVPPLYGGFPNPVLPLTQNISYAAPLGHTMGTPFTDIQGTAANYHIVGGFGGPATFTRNAGVTLLSPGIWLNQPSTATGYAYEQVNFAMVYSVSASGLLAGPVGPRPLLVTGNLLPGGNAQFGANINYWWLSVIPGSTIVTGITNLGSLQYNYVVPNVTGPFTAFVNHAPSVLAGATGFGFLEITGDMFVAGDPFSISVTGDTIVPEPSTMALYATGLFSLGLFSVRRRRQTSAE